MARLGRRVGDREAVRQALEEQTASAGKAEPKRATAFLSVGPAATADLRISPFATATLEFEEVR